MPYLMILIIVATLVIVFWAAAQASKRASENIRELAAMLGLQADIRPPALGLFYTDPRAAGQWRGKAMEIYTYTTGSGKSRMQWCAVAAALRADGGLRFTLQPQGFGTKVMEMFGASEIQVGDADFDRRWFIQTNQPDFLRAALLPELRAKIFTLAAEPSASRLKLMLEDGRVRYAEQGSFASARVAGRIGQAAEVVADLADVAEVFAAERK